MVSMKRQSHDSGVGGKVGISEVDLKMTKSTFFGRTGAVRLSPQMLS
jgi:hypothetical protein